MGEGVNCMVMDGNQTWGGDHFVVYTVVMLYSCTSGTYILKTPK